MGKREILRALMIEAFPNVPVEEIDDALDRSEVFVRLQAIKARAIAAGEGAK